MIVAEEKVRATYQWLIHLLDDPDLNDSLRFLRERGIIHSQRFMEAIERIKDASGQKNFLVKQKYSTAVDFFTPAVEYLFS